jgi:hypothetical protein
MKRKNSREPVKKARRPFLTGSVILFEAGRCPLKLPRVIPPFSIMGWFLQAETAAAKSRGC